MKDFKNFGIRIRKDEERNYYAIWNDLQTIRLDLGEEIKLPYERSEFYDVAITERCNAMCDFCYVSADSMKEDFRGICETWKKWINTFPEDTTVKLREDWWIGRLLTGYSLCPEEFELKAMLVRGIVEKRKIRYTSKPFQIAIGSLGEPTIHPDFPKFLEEVYRSEVVPNYTTNGIVMSDEILEATRNFVGGVAVSYGNKGIRDKANKTIERLLKDGECKVMIHHLISDTDSLRELEEAEDRWGKDISYHVLLPLKKHGRSKEEMSESTYLELVELIGRKGWDNLAFGMWFLPFMKKWPGSIKCWEYPSETYSSNLILRNERIQITPSSFNLEVKYENS